MQTAPDLSVRDHARSRDERVVGERDAVVEGRVTACRAALVAFSGPLLLRRRNRTRETRKLQK